MKGLWPAALFSLLALNGLAQKTKQQTVFGPEIDMERPLKIPPSFVKQLNKEDRTQLSRCQADKELASIRRKNAIDHFVGSRLDTWNKEGRKTLLIVRSNSLCFNGAHNSRFWILAKEKTGGYKMLFETAADGLEVSWEASRTYPNLDVFSHTAVEGFTDTVKYIRGAYRVTSCYVEALGAENPGRRRIKCARYNWEFRK